MSELDTFPRAWRSRCFAESIGDGLRKHREADRFEATTVDSTDEALH